MSEKNHTVKWDVRACPEIYGTKEEIVKLRDACDDTLKELEADKKPRKGDIGKTPGSSTVFFDGDRWRFFGMAMFVDRDVKVQTVFNAFDVRAQGPIVIGMSVTKAIELRDHLNSYYSVIADACDTALGRYEKGKE